MAEKHRNETGNDFRINFIAVLVYLFTCAFFVYHIPVLKITMKLKMIWNTLPSDWVYYLMYKMFERFKGNNVRTIVLSNIRPPQLLAVTVRFVSFPYGHHVELVDCYWILSVCFIDNYGYVVTSIASSFPWLWPTELHLFKILYMHEQIKSS